MPSQLSITFGPIAFWKEQEPEAKAARKNNGVQQAGELSLGFLSLLTFKTMKGGHDPQDLGQEWEQVPGRSTAQL